MRPILTALNGGLVSSARSNGFGRTKATVSNAGLSLGTVKLREPLGSVGTTGPTSEREREREKERRREERTVMRVEQEESVDELIEYE